MNSYLRYIIISVLSSTLSTTYINTLHKKHLDSITDELNSQCEENKIDPDPKKIQGMTGEEILGIFYRSIDFKKGKYGWNSKLS